MSKQKSYDVVSSGGQSIYVASHGDPFFNGNWSESYECHACGLQFRREEGVFFRGKFYGKPCGCHTDIGSILRKERKDVAPVEEPKRRI